MRSVAPGKYFYIFLSILTLCAYGFFVYAAAPSGGYIPGANSPDGTLDPDCEPGDADCFVNTGWVLDPTNSYVYNTTDNIGIGDTTPVAALTVGSGDLFQVSSAGAIAAVTNYTQGTGKMSVTSNNSSGTGTSSAMALNANSLFGGTGFYAASSSLYNGNLIDLTVTSGAPASDSYRVLNIATSGTDDTGGASIGASVINSHTGGAQSSGIGMLSNTYGSSINGRANLAGIFVAGTAAFDFFSSGLPPTGTDTINTALYAAASGGDYNYAGIFASGNVGIGDATPDFLLDTEGDTASSYVANFFNDGNDDNRWGIQIQAGADTPSAGKWIQFNDGDGGDVGSICYTGGQANTCAPSDERLKDNINDTDINLNDLLGIQVRDFSYRSDETETIRHGFIAQELYEIYPDAVMKPENPNEFWKVSYTQLTPLIVKSIQELNLKIESIDTQAATIMANETLFEQFRNWFADVSNGIVKLFAGEIETKKLCVADEAGDKTCITKSELDEILFGQDIVPVTNTDPVDDATTDDVVDNTTTDDSVTDDTVDDTTSDDTTDDQDQTTDTVSDLEPETIPEEEDPEVISEEDPAPVEDATPEPDAVDEPQQ